MFKTLTYIGEKLNHWDIMWAVGGSMMLNQFGLADKPNDIDIFVDSNEIEKVDEIFKRIGQKKKQKSLPHIQQNTFMSI